MPAAPRRLLIPLAAFVGMFAVLCAATRGFALTDTFDLLDGTGWAAGCLNRGVFSSCGWQVSQFALLQYLPALAFHALGLSYMGAFSGLVALNGLAVLGMAAIVAVTTGRIAGVAVAALAAAVVLASPFIWYAHAGYGEPLATLALTGFVALMVLRGPPGLIAATALLAGISKETAFPFVLALAVIAWLVRNRDFRRAEVLAVVGGVAGAVVLNSLFNVFRYGVIDNTRYTPSVYRVPFGQAANHFAGLLLSPTGGLLWMWPGFVAILVAGVGFGVRRRRIVEPGLAILALFAALLVLFAEWYAPFGGTTWGPRLLLPWLPPLLILCVAAYPGAFAVAARRLVGGTRAAAIAAGLLLLVSGLPNLIAAVDSTRYFHARPGLLADRRELTIRPYSPDSTCPRFPRIEQSRSYYYGCLRHDIWHRGFVPAIAYGQLKRARVLVFALVWCAALLGLLAFARRSAAVQEPARA